MTTQTAHPNVRYLSAAEISMVAGGQTATEQSLMSTFSNNNGIQLNNSWGYSDDGEFFQDSDCNGYYDLVYFNMAGNGGNDWVVSFDGGWHWERTDRPDYYHGGCVYVLDSAN